MTIDHKHRPPLRQTYAAPLDPPGCLIHVRVSVDEALDHLGELRASGEYVPVGDPWIEPGDEVIGFVVLRKPVPSWWN